MWLRGYMTPGGVIIFISPQRKWTVFPPLEAWRGTTCPLQERVKVFTQIINLQEGGITNNKYLTSGRSDPQSLQRRGNVVSHVPSSGG